MTVEPCYDLGNLDARLVWIVDGGPRPPRRLPRGEPTCVVCVDRGLDHALRAGLAPDAVIGDFDSVGAASLRRALELRPNLVVRRHSHDKNRSDLDLALSFVSGLDADEIALVSSGSGRLDHTLISLTVLARPRYAALALTAYIGASVVRAATAGTGLELSSDDGNLLTLAAVGGTASLRTAGLRWNLTPRTPLGGASSLGLSNEIVAAGAHVEVRAGSVLALQTHGKPLR